MKSSGNRAVSGESLFLVEFTSQGGRVESRIEAIAVSGSLSADHVLAMKASGRWGEQMLRADIKSCNVGIACGLEICAGILLQSDRATGGQNGRFCLVQARFASLDIHP